MAESNQTAPLMLSRSTLDRDALRRDDPHLTTRLLDSASTRVLHLHGERMPTQVVDGAVQLAFREPRADDSALPLGYLGRVGEASIVAAYDEPEDAPQDRGATDPAELRQQLTRTHRSLRSLAPHLSVGDLGVATTAAAMANWIVTQRFCSHCAQPLDLVQSGWAMRCENGHTHFPRTDAAVIMSVTDPADRLLLAQGVRFALPTGMSVLAGFLEPGESLEAAVRREVMEEVGLTLDRADFVDNQPWPMPASLMVGFAATTSQTEFRLDPHEILRAEWFSRDELDAALASGELTIPPRLSIARALIERWYGGALPDQPGDLV